jgi:hypothetical protein
MPNIGVANGEAQQEILLEFEKLVEVEPVAA